MDTGKNINSVGQCNANVVADLSSFVYGHDRPG